MKMRTLLLLSVLFMLGFTACQQDPKADESVSEASITGQISSRQSMRVPPDAKITVNIFDFDKGEKSGLLSSNTFAVGATDIPIPFEIFYDENKVQEDTRYAINSYITYADRIVFFQPKPLEIISNGLSKNIAIMMKNGSTRLMIRGRIKFDTEVELADDTEVIARLVDYTDNSKDAVIKNEFSLEPGNVAPPYTFTLDYTPGSINPNGKYGIEARIIQKGQLTHSSEAPVEVINNGVTNGFEVTVKPLK